MMNYKPCLFNREFDEVRDSREWDIYVKRIPFKVYPDMKDLAVRNWHDENGDDEYVPLHPVFKAYEIDCEFVYVGKHGMANYKIREFLGYLSYGGSFGMYDMYTKIGRSDVRYVGYSENVLYRRDRSNDVVVFTVKLKVNNPLDDIILVK